MKNNIAIKSSLPTVKVRILTANANGKKSGFIQRVVASPVKTELEYTGCTCWAHN